VVAHPDILPQLLSYCDKTTQTTCLRVNSAFFYAVGPLLYRDVCLPPYGSEEEEKYSTLFLGAGGSSSDENPQRSRGFKEQLLRHVRRLDLTNTEDCPCQLPEFEAAAKILHSLELFRFTPCYDPGMSSG
jgi:hypothetical protein